MEQRHEQSRRIHILRDSVAQKIAAGEVIDRPFSVLRELLDNSIDAGADSIDVHIEDGGVKRIRVIDNGGGMERNDLELCFLPHATSKITSAEDIYRLHTLGFRGEALSSVAACANLLITSGTGKDQAHTLEIRNGSPIRLEISEASKGTLVDVSDLFFSMPGRKKFLKSAGAESAACFRMFLEKAVPFPSVQFRFFAQNRMKIFLPKTSMKERVLQAYPDQFTGHFLHETTVDAGMFRIHAVFSSPSLHRRDRRFIHIHVNRRRIQEYSLVQAVRYAYDELLPGGSFPVAFVFIDIDPELVDFNIHPAKKEVKIKNLPAVHHQLVHSLKEYLNKNFLVPDEWRQNLGTDRSQEFENLLDSPGAATASPRTLSHGESSHRDHPAASSEDSRFSIDIKKWKDFAVESAAERRRMYRAEENMESQPAETPGDPTLREQIDAGPDLPRYIGQVFKLFLIAQQGEQLYLIDQHAAHERIIYDTLLNDHGSPQKLLVPIEFELEPDREVILEQRLESFAEAGILTEKTDDSTWRITHLPDRFSGLEREIIVFLKEQDVPDQSFRAGLFADLACRAAIKDGEVLDSYSAEQLCRKALALPVPRCPHGRPIWLRISRQELFQVVGRF